MARFAVIGLGRFGTVLATSLVRMKGEVVAIDRSRELIDNIKDEVSLAIRMDATEKEALESQGIDEMDVAIVAIGEDFEAACLAVSLLKELNPAMRVVARATTEVRGRILRRIGADDVVFPERESAERAARALAFPNLLDADELAAGIIQARLRTPPEFVGRSPVELDLRRKYDVNLVAIHRPKAKVAVVIPSPETKIEADDTLVLIGNAERIEYLSQLSRR